MSENIELLSRTKYSNIGDLLADAKLLDPDNDILQLSIERYYRHGKDFDLKTIIHALEFYETLK